MLPKVTLRRKPWEDYSFSFGKSMFVFRGGVAQQVPVAVALELKKRKNESGEPLFDVSGMPVVPVQSVPVQALAQSKESQNVHGTKVKKANQTRFAAWR